ncbi:MAG: hypothetical protein Kow0092_31480 [Deferrisomatales bacterium]
MRKEKDDDLVRCERWTLISQGLSLPVFAAWPAGGPAGPWPTVQIHHGGGGYDPLYEHMARSLAALGFVGVTLVHRGYPGAQGRMEYGKGEIADIGALGEELARRPQVDADHMGIMGYSRGGHNALLAAAHLGGFRAVAAWSAPTDMFVHVQVHPWIADLIGGTPDQVREEYEVRSSIRWAHRIRCPVLLLHGEADDVVPAAHSRRLAERLRELGSPCELEILPGEGHVWSPTGFARCWERTVRFFQTHLAS